MSLYGLSLDAIVRSRSLGAGGSGGPTQGGAENALSALAKYIPTEVVAIYLIGISITSNSNLSGAFIRPITPYVALIIATPPVFYLIFTAQFRAARAENEWQKLADLPKWRFIAATIAFAVWALAVPNNGIMPASQMLLAAFAALLISTLLTLMERALEPR